MTSLIRNRNAVPNEWALLQSASGPDAFSALRGRKVLLPLELILSDEDEARAQLGAIGVWLDSHQDLASIENRIADFQLIALNFPVFSDGRPFSLARRLRLDLGFTGEIRAIGDVLRDQLFFLERCGFDSFALRSDQDVDECLSAFDDFSSTYTATALNQEPIFRRR